MSDLGFNKIAFCVLGTGLVLIGLNEASHAMFHHEKHEYAGYHIEVAEATTGEAVVEGPRDYGKLLAAADVTKGAQQSQKCTQCHTFTQGGAALQGPNLYGILGRDIASVAGFPGYSKGPGSLSEVEGEWTYEKLDKFIEGPRQFAPKTAMNFAGINSQFTGLQDRMNLIAYLRTLGSENIPLPDPLPETPAATPAEGAQPTDPNAPAQGEAGNPAAPAPGQPAAPGSPPAPGGAPTPAPAPH